MKRYINTAERRAPRIDDFDNCRRLVPGAFAKTKLPRWKYRAGEYSPWGIYCLVTEALREYSEATGKTWPWNAGAFSLRGCGMSRRPRKDDDGVFDAAARFSGWLRAIAAAPKAHRMVVQLIDHGVESSRGIGSPHQMLDPVGLARANPSPGRLNRMIAAVIRRADQILRPYGVRVSWASLCEVFQKPVRRVGKAAFKAARLTAWQLLRRETAIGFNSQEGADPLVLMSGWKEFVQADVRVKAWAVDRVTSGEFRTIREALAASSRLVEDTTGGVAAMVDTTMALTLHGVMVAPAWIEETEGRRRTRRLGRRITFLRMGDRSYHSWAQGPRRALAEALEAWRCQELLQQQRAEEAQLEEICRAGGTQAFSILVYPEHSYRAGNCEPGTAAWINRHRLQGRHFLPLAELWKLADEPRAKNAARIAAREALAHATC